MSTFDFAAQIVLFLITIVGTLVFGAFVYIGRQALLTLKEAYLKLVHVDECMDLVKKASEEDRALLKLHRNEAESRDKRIAELEKDYAGLEGWIKGKYGLSTDASITEIRS